MAVGGVGGGRWRWWRTTTGRRCRVSTFTPAVLNVFVARGRVYNSNNKIRDKEFMISAAAAAAATAATGGALLAYEALSRCC